MWTALRCVALASSRGNVAQASTFDFCGTSSNPVRINGGQSPPNDRCVDGNYHGFNYTTTNETASATQQCAVVKQYSNGLGGNETAPSCAYTTYSYPGCSNGYSCYGYAAIINQDCCIQAIFYGFASKFTA